MIVFNNYFKIVKRYIPTIIMFTTILCFFSVLATSNFEGSADFEEIKPNLAIINNDSDSTITSNFVAYIEANSTIVNLKTDDDSLKDALFFRKVDEIITIPLNFGEELIQGHKPKIDTMKVPDSTSSMYTEMLLNRYLNQVNIYLEAGFSEEEISRSLRKDLKETTNIKLLSSDSEEITKLNFFYNFTNYTILAVIIFIISTVMGSFMDRNLNRRNVMGTLSHRKLNFQLLLGNSAIALGIWLLYASIALIIYPNAMLSSHGLLYLITSLIFSLVALSIGFLIGITIRNKEAQSGITNVIALGSSFICGAFVPQEFLGSFVLTIAKVFPSYWYISANNNISLLTNFNFHNLSQIMINWGIMLLFIVLFFIITNIISKKKRRSE